MSRKKKRSKQPSQVPPLDERHYAAMDLMIAATRYESKTGSYRWFRKDEIAEVVGVSRMQLYRWEQRKDFQREKEKRLRAYWRRRTPKKNPYVELSLGGDVSALTTLMNALQG